MLIAVKVFTRDGYSFVLFIHYFHNNNKTITSTIADIHPVKPDNRFKFKGGARFAWCRGTKGIGHNPCTIVFNLISSPYHKT